MIVYQTTPGLDKEIASEGCYFRVVLKIVEIITGINFTVDQINKIYRVCFRVGYVGNKISPIYLNERAINGIAQVASGMTGNHVFMKRVFDNDHYNFRAGLYTRLTNSGGKVFHFVLMPGPLTEGWDPWSESGSRTAKIGTFDSSRLIMAEAI